MIEKIGGKVTGVKLVNFGLATRIGNKVLLYERVGTPYYMSPEMLKGKYNEKCDIWSCGIIIHILLMGKPPFDGPTEKDIKTKIMTTHLDV